MSKLYFRLESADLFRGQQKCFICETRFKTYPAMFTLGIKEVDTAWHLCAGCVLSDSRTLAEKARASAAKHRARVERIQRKPEGEWTKAEEDYVELDSPHEEQEEVADMLARVPGLPALRNHALAVHIARFYVGERERKAKKRTEAA